MVYERISKKQQFVNFILKKIQKNYFVRFLLCIKVMSKNNHFSRPDRSFKSFDFF
jgi:hypothetical protein